MRFEKTIRPRKDTTLIFAAAILWFMLLCTNGWSQNISAAEYFFNTDPGQGNATPLTIPSGGEVTFTRTIPTTSLPQGFHFLGMRVKETGGVWSLFEARGFYITAATTDVPNIVSAEYFFDTDPGQGNGINIPITSGATTNFTVPVPTSSLSPGFHFLAIRTKGADGRWGIFESRGFYITSATTDVPNIIAAEYFIDTDPGIGNAESITPIAAGGTVTFTASIPASLTPGFHTLAIRTKRDDGTWGLFEARGFYVSPTNTDVADIVAAEYFFEDTDPGEGNGNAVSVTPGPEVNETLSIATTGLPTGPQQLSLRVQDAKGIWSTVETQPFTVLACTPPPPPTAPDVSRCTAGTITLTATAGATGTQVYRWYEDATTSVILFTGAAFTTPELSINTPYFVSVFDPATLCESNRTTVTAGVTIIDQPVLNISSVTICEGNSILVSAPTDFTNYTWSNGETTREILVTVSGSYTVIVGNGTCSSIPSAAAQVTVTPRPAKPVVTPSGTTSLCDGSTVTLTAPEGFTYAWSSGQTSREIVVSASGNYSVIVTDANGCTSVPSDAIAVTANTTPAKPVIETFGSTTLCGTNTIGLLAPLGFSIYQWSSGQTVAGITVASAGSYTVVVGNDANCLSVASDPVVVTATGQPCTGTGGMNAPPVISSQTFSVQIEGQLQTDLTPFISDPDNNLNFNSLRVIDNQTSRGNQASIDAAYNLIVNYQGDAFTGSDRVTVEVCDLLVACSQGFFDIDVVGGVVVFNGLSPDGDGINDFMFVKYIDVVEGASQNKVTIFNRWGDLVFDIQNYNNTDRVFTGISNKGSELPSGTYYYKLEFTDNLQALTGFITLMR